MYRAAGTVGVWRTQIHVAEPLSSSRVSSASFGGLAMLQHQLLHLQQLDDGD
jgi:hypothetical protein